LAEWLAEEGIGEHRAIRLEGDRIVAARIDWPGELTVGLVEEAVLVSRAAGSRRGSARFASGEEALVDKLPPSASEGAKIRLEVTRPALGERGRRKLARAKPTDAAPRPAPTLAEALRTEGHDVRVVREFPAGDGSELAAEAFAGEVAFPGGSLQFSPTPAMLLVDVDGTLAPRALALAAVAPLAEALRRFDVGGSIGIDFPTLATKEDRRAVDEALAAALADWQHERTAMNGFGFVQLIARLERPSLLHRAAFQRAGMAARALLRRAELLQGPGAVLLSGHPALEAPLKPEWLAELARRTGREVRWEARPTLALEAPQAQLVPR
jgi:ribonuclease G